MFVVLEEQIKIPVVILSEHCPQLAMFYVPLVQFCRERLLELVDVRFDAFCIGVLLRRIDLAFVAQRRKASEVVIVFGEFECLVSELVPPLGRLKTLARGSLR